MKKNILVLFSLLLANIPMRAQEKVEIIFVENLSEYLKQNNISEFYFEKFGEVLRNHHITYTPNEKWIVESSDLCSVVDDDSCPLNKTLGLKLGRLSHYKGKCLLAIDTSPKLSSGKKLTLPFQEGLAKEYVFTNVANHFEFGKPYRSIRSQTLKDVEMLVTYYPIETARDVFNGVSMFVYPLNFQGETYQGQYTCGRGVVVFSKNNVPLELYFIMTDESVADFDKYLSELKGVFTFQNIDSTN